MARHDSTASETTPALSAAVAPHSGQSIDPLLPTGWFNCDGGRTAAGYRGHTGDCVVRAIAIATGIPYRIVYDDINAIAEHERAAAGQTRSSARTGVHKATYMTYLAGLGWIWTPTMAIGQGCRVHMRRAELPRGRIIVRLSRHLCCVIDGIAYDTMDHARGGTRCVYGYWSRP